MSEDEIKTPETDEEAPAVGPHDDAEAIPEELHPKPEEIRAIVEALTFVSKEPVTMKELARMFKGVDKAVIEAQIEELKALYAADNRGLQFIEVAGGYQITSRPEHNEWVRELLDPRSPARLSTQALETLAVIAYKQPATLPEIIELRGIKSGGVVKTLLERRLIKIVGRKEVVGRPLLYGTTKEFLLQFGLKDLEDLPKIEDFAEILGEDVDVVGLKRALDTPTPLDVPLLDPDPPDPAQRDIPFDSTVEAADILEAAERAKAEAEGSEPASSDAPDSDKEGS
ncbi:MAG TPA: SMC-Scp complex subunit ScpB [Vicinamibacteria bacterium]|nr:SMC-Scp complex subunit ScpB [Vicinamibacteria bacterium]